MGCTTSRVYGARSREIENGSASEEGCCIICCKPPVVRTDEEEERERESVSCEACLNNKCRLRYYAVDLLKSSRDWCRSEEGTTESISAQADMLENAEGSIPGPSHVEVESPVQGFIGKQKGSVNPPRYGHFPMKKYVSDETQIPRLRLDSFEIDESSIFPMETEISTRIESNETYKSIKLTSDVLFPRTELSIEKVNPDKPLISLIDKIQKMDGQDLNTVLDTAKISPCSARITSSLCENEYLETVSTIHVIPKDQIQSALSSLSLGLRVPEIVQESYSHMTEKARNNIELVETKMEENFPMLLIDDTQCVHEHQSFERPNISSGDFPRKWQVSKSSSLRLTRNDTEVDNKSARSKSLGNISCDTSFSLENFPSADPQSKIQNVSESSSCSHNRRRFSLCTFPEVCSNEQPKIMRRSLNSISKQSGIVQIEQSVSQNVTHLRSASEVVETAHVHSSIRSVKNLQSLEPGNTSSHQEFLNSSTGSKHLVSEDHLLKEQEVLKRQSSSSSANENSRGTNSSSPLNPQRRLSPPRPPYDKEWGGYGISDPGQFQNKYESFDDRRRSRSTDGVLAEISSVLAVLPRILSPERHWQKSPGTCNKTGTPTRARRGSQSTTDDVSEIPYDSDTASTAKSTSESGSSDDHKKTKSGELPVKTMRESRFSVRANSRDEKYPDVLETKDVFKSKLNSADGERTRPEDRTTEVSTAELPVHEAEVMPFGSHEGVKSSSETNTSDENIFKLNKLFLEKHLSSTSAKPLVQEIENQSNSISNSQSRDSFLLTYYSWGRRRRIPFHGTESVRERSSESQSGSENRRSSASGNFLVPQVIFGNIGDHRDPRRSRSVPNLDSFRNETSL